MLDAITAYTVNHLETINPMFNRVLHILFLASVDSAIFILCLYMMIITGVYPKKKLSKAGIFLPFVLNIVVVICSMQSLDYVKGKSTNYYTRI